MLLLTAIRNGRRFIVPLASVPNTQRLIRHYCHTVEKERVIKDEKVAAVTLSEHDEDQYEKNVKDRILEKALEFVPTHGWTVDALCAGAEAVGYPGITHGLFPNGGADLVHYFNVKCNQKLMDQMKTVSSYSSNIVCAYTIFILQKLNKDYVSHSGLMKT